MARAVEAIGVAQADTRFDPTVKPVFCNPLFTTLDYRAQFAACGGGAILAGYGGGNANVRKGSAHSILPALRASVEAGTFVAVTSQVPLEPYDAEYETGLALLEAGGVPCGDLPLADAQVKLSYLLGHAREIASAAAEAGVEPRRPPHGGLPLGRHHAPRRHLWCLPRRRRPPHRLARPPSGPLRRHFPSTRRLGASLKAVVQ